MTTSAQIDAALAEARERDRDGAGRRNPGHLVLCPACGLLVRRLETVRPVEGSSAMAAGPPVLVAPDALAGNWSYPLHGYGEDRLDGRAAETRGALWVVQTARCGGPAAALFDAPPPTVSGYRAHDLDCPSHSDGSGSAHDAGA